MSALGKALEPAYRSKLERDYAAHLNVLIRAGAIRAWWFETTTFKLGHDCRLTPDFQVQLNDLSIEYHETKGFRRDDAMAKLRIAASQQPFVFRLVTRSKEGEWEICEVGAPAKKRATLAELRGAAPNCTDGKSSEDFVADLRASWPPPDHGATAAPQSEPMAKLNGKDVTREFALDLIRKYG